MEKKRISLIFIILGLAVIALPLLGLISVSLITGFIIIFAGLGLITGGSFDMHDTRNSRILKVGLGLILTFIGMVFAVSPEIFSSIVGLLIWLVGGVLIIGGIVEIITKSTNNRWNGTISLIFGLVYVIIGSLITSDPRILGVIIGLWLLITGIIILKEDKEVREE